MGGYLAELWGNALHAEAPTTPGPLDNSWYRSAGFVTQSGVIISPESILFANTALACVRVISRSIAALPCKTYRRLPRGKMEDRANPLWSVLHDKPNDHMTAFEFWQLLMVHVLLWGGFYAEIVSGNGRLVDQLLPMNPSRVRVRKLVTGEIVYEYTEPNGQPKTFLAGSVFHVQGLSVDGVIGLQPAELAREVIGLALSAQGYAANLFKNDARPGGLLTTDQPMQQEARQQMAQSWKNAHAGMGDHHEIAVLSGGLQFKTVSLNARESQMIESRKFQAVEIATFFGVQPHKVGLLDRATFSNIEHQSIEFVQDTVTPWLVSIEQRISFSLIAPAAQNETFVEFLIEGMLRGDSQTRGEVQNIRILNGSLSPNEARAIENMNPRPGGDDFLSPLNMRQGAAAPQGEPGPAPSVPSRAEALAESAARRAVARETGQIAKLAERNPDATIDKWSELLAGFYVVHAAWLEAAIPMSAIQAIEYCNASALCLEYGGTGIIETWEAERVSVLAALILERDNDG